MSRRPTVSNFFTQKGGSSPLADPGPVRVVAARSVTSMVLQAALELGIFEQLGDKTLTLQDLAAKVGVPPSRQFFDLLDILRGTNFSLLLKEGAQSYKNTPVASKYLTKSSPYYVGDHYKPNKELWQNYAKLDDWIEKSEAPQASSTITPNAFAAKFQDSLFTVGLPEFISTTLHATDKSQHSKVLLIGAQSTAVVHELTTLYPSAVITVLDTADLLHKVKTSDKVKTEAYDLFGGADLPSSIASTAFDLVVTSNVLYRAGEDKTNFITKVLSPVVAKSPRQWALLFELLDAHPLPCPLSGAKFQLALDVISPTAVVPSIDHLRNQLKAGELEAKQALVSAAPLALQAILVTGKNPTVPPFQVERQLPSLENAVVLLRESAGVVELGCCYVAAKSKLYEALHEGNVHPDDFSSKNKLNPKGTKLMLEILFDLGWISRNAPGDYAKQPIIDSIVASYGFLAQAAFTINFKQSYPAWRDASQVIKESDKPTAATVPITRILSIVGASGISGASLPHYDFNNAKEVLILAGHLARLPMMLIETFPQLHVTVMDMPDIIANQGGIKDELAAYEHKDKITVISHDILTTEWPLSGKKFDAIISADLLCRVTGDNEVESKKALLKKVHNALNDGGKLYCIELLIGSNTGPWHAAAADLAWYLRKVAGKVWTTTEREELFPQAGLFVERDVELPSPVWYTLTIATAH